VITTSESKLQGAVGALDLPDLAPERSDAASSAAAEQALGNAGVHGPEPNTAAVTDGPSTPPAVGPVATDAPGFALQRPVWPAPADSPKYVGRPSLDLQADRGLRMCALALHHLNRASQLFSAIKRHGLSVGEEGRTASGRQGGSDGADLIRAIFTSSFLVGIGDAQAVVANVLSDPAEYARYHGALEKYGVALVEGRPGRRRSGLGSKRLLFLDLDRILGRLLRTTGWRERDSDTLLLSLPEARREQHWIAGNRVWGVVIPYAHWVKLCPADDLAAK
jgi:hypothetical protein